MTIPHFTSWQLKNLVLKYSYSGIKLKDLVQFVKQELKLTEVECNECFPNGENKLNNYVRMAAWELKNNNELLQFLAKGYYKITDKGISHLKKHNIKIPDFCDNKIIVQNPDWSRDELLIALEFYLSYKPKIPSKTSPEIKELSNKLRQVNYELGIFGNSKFRNTNGVYMKLMNFRRFDPEYKGDGLTGGSKEEEVVWNLYANKPEELKHIVSAILSFSSLSGNENQHAWNEVFLEIEEAEEGKLLSRVHVIRERSATITQKKKIQFKRSNGKIFCEVCEFDFEKHYGQHGVDFIECHHTRPISQYSPGETTNIKDLALLCSNCHRMIHRRSPWLSIKQLKDIIVK